MLLFSCSCGWGLGLGLEYTSNFCCCSGHHHIPDLQGFVASSPMGPAEPSAITDRHLNSEPLCLSQVPTQPQAGSTSASYWPAQNSGAREILLQLYREHLVSKLLREMPG